MKLQKGSPILLAGLAVMLSGCFATTSQLEALREDVLQQRAEADANDSIRAVQLVQILTTLRTVTDSVSGFSTRLNRMNAQSQADMRELKLQVAGISEITGQSQERLQQLRAQLEQRNKQLPPPTTPAVATGDTLAATPAAPPPDAPGPNELFQIGRDQLTRGGNSAARAAFSDLLQRFPDSELAADAQFYIAEAFAAEGSAAPADSAYATVIARYPASSRAPTSLYKRAFLAQSAGRTTAARRLYNDLIRKYPNSDEAELARERLRVLG
ncbi:MAG TPA: tetratricopeptide repeat protein [Gemmatimonadaceae bacterium]|nr:tetratricopeptide repeat protein [Gemmatimonadaceae bacterium]